MTSNLKSRTRRNALITLSASLAAATAFQGVATAQTTAKPIKVTYAVATRDLNVGYPFATLPLALGYFAEEGLEVEVVPGGGRVPGRYRPLHNRS